MAFVGCQIRSNHHGGEGYMPMYVAHFTEQEALSTILMEANAAGFNFIAAQSEHIFPLHIQDMWIRTFEPNEALMYISVDYIDEEKGVAIAHIHDWMPELRGQQHAQHVFWNRNDVITITTDKLSTDGKEIIIAVFVNPQGHVVIDGFSPDNAEANVLDVKDQLTAQVHNFVQWFNVDRHANRIENIFVATHISPKIDDYLYTATFFSRQNALDIIQKEAATAGLNLQPVATERILQTYAFRYNRQHEFSAVTLPIQLVDEAQGVTIALFHEWEKYSTWPYFMSCEEITVMLENITPPIGNEAALGILVNPVVAMRQSYDDLHELELKSESDKQFEDAQNKLITQLHNFIKWLQDNEIIN